MIDTFSHELPAIDYFSEDARDDAMYEARQTWTAAPPAPVKRHTLEGLTTPEQRAALAERFGPGHVRPSFGFAGECWLYGVTFWPDGSTT